MSKVTVVDYTGYGMGSEYAARILAFTKSTRLNLSPKALDDFMELKTWKEIYEELKYMASTLPSSWEFVSITFLFSDVSRACAQQITRTRTASYAMQAQRVVDVREAGYHVPENLDEAQSGYFGHVMKTQIKKYGELIDAGMEPQDAREVLPIGIHCNLVARYNLRALVDLLAKRRSLRVQSEYRELCMAMEKETLRCWPWAALFFKDRHSAALDQLERIAEENPELRVRIAKAVDLIRTNREG